MRPLKQLHDAKLLHLCNLLHQKGKSHKQNHMKMTQKKGEQTEDVGPKVAHSACTLPICEVLLTKTNNSLPFTRALIYRSFLSLGKGQRFNEPKQLVPTEIVKEDWKSVRVLSSQSPIFTSSIENIYTVHTPILLIL